MKPRFNVDSSAAISDLIAIHQEQQLQPHEFTANFFIELYAEVTGVQLDIRHAKHWLNRQQRKNRLTRRKCFADGAQQWCYASSKGEAESARQAAQDMVAVHQAQQLQPGEFTVYDYIAQLSQETGKRLDKRAATRFLETQVQAGKLTRRLCMYEGTWQGCYVANNQNLT